MSRIPALVLVLACSAGGPGHASSLADACLQQAPRLVDRLVAHDYVAANGQLGPTMRMMFSPETLEGNWDAMSRQFGPYVSHGKPAVFQDDGKDAFIRVPITFAHGGKTMQITCSKDQDGQVSSLAFL